MLKIHPTVPSSCAASWCSIRYDWNVASVFISPRQATSESQHPKTTSQACRPPSGYVSFAVPEVPCRWRSSASSSASLGLLRMVHRGGVSRPGRACVGWIEGFSSDDESESMPLCPAGVRCAVSALPGVFSAHAGDDGLVCVSSWLLVLEEESSAVGMMTSKQHSAMLCS